MHWWYRCTGDTLTHQIHVLSKVFSLFFFSLKILAGKRLYVWCWNSRWFCSYWLLHYQPLYCQELIKKEVNRCGFAKLVEEILLPHRSHLLGEIASCQLSIVLIHWTANRILVTQKSPLVYAIVDFIIIIKLYSTTQRARRITVDSFYYVYLWASGNFASGEKPHFYKPFERVHTDVVDSVTQ